MSEIFAYSDYVILKPTEPKSENSTSQGIILPTDVNPSFIYGQIRSCGAECRRNISGKYVYINKISAMRLTHDGEDYYIVSEKDIVALVS